MKKFKTLKIKGKYTRNGKKHLSLPIFDPVFNKYNVYKYERGVIVRTVKFKQLKTAYEFLYTQSIKGLGVEINGSIRYDYHLEQDRIEEWNNQLFKKYDIKKEDLTEEEIQEFKKENHFRLKPVKKIDLNNISKDELPIIQNINILEEVLSLKVKGYNDQEIISVIKENHTISSVTAQFYVREVNNLIKERAGEDIENTIRLHTTRYERLYQWFKENGYDRSAMKALFNKEKLNGLHNEVIELEMSNVILPVQKDVEYNLDLLDYGEKICLGKYLSKARGIETE